MNNRVSIIVPGHNAQSYLMNLFEALVNLEYENFEVIYVDDASKDQSLDVAKRFKHLLPLKILKLKKRKGASYARNVGAKLSDPSTKYYAFLDVDTIPTPSYLRELVDVLEKEEKIAMAQSLILDARSKRIQWGLTKILPYTFAFVPDDKELFEEEYYLTAYAVSASAIIRAEIFKMLNGFDVKIPFMGEDVDLSLRCWLAGYKVVMVPRSIVYHFGGSHVIDKSYKEYINFKHILRTMIKCLEFKRLIPSITIKMLYNYSKGKFYYIPSIDWIIDAIKERKNVQRIRKIKEEELLHFLRI